ncbi:ferrochelatase [Sulfurifustis variabilis]|uniref:Ferrochelatase n=1 Tax=Sulfurifustis variabilis TaxID=1675686 RepID=A0A1C7AG18_9GAMM|nr:ferrochelatase [Sulfurifustis variabilis]BAU50398.1 ferrochelatase [Sulfurifustis variabilis]
MDRRPAVVLLNLGGPDSLGAVRPFLYNLFADPDIFKFPLGAVLQKPLAALIAWRRAPEAAKGYAAIGGKSPLLENTLVQAQALQHALADEEDKLARVAGTRRALPAGSDNAPLADVHVCMRYWHPMAPEVVGRLKAAGYTRVVLLPLYPQYSVTTTGSSYNDFRRACERASYRPELRLIREWYDDADYHQAIVDSIENEMSRFPVPDPERIELLFSAHGLPKKVVDAGDPYRDHIEATYAAVRSRLGWPHVALCYQSRVGPLEWLRPYTDDVIREKAAAGTKQMLVYPIAFVSDHVETLFELGITYAELARKRGIAHYRVAPALNAHPLLIRALARRVREALA